MDNIGSKRFKVLFHYEDLCEIPYDELSNQGTKNVLSYSDNDGSAIKPCIIDDEIEVTATSFMQALHFAHIQIEQKYLLKSNEYEIDSCCEIK